MQQQIWVTRSGAVCTAIASGLQHVMNDLDAASAVIPTMLGRQKPEEALEGSSALSVLHRWWAVLPCSLYGMLGYRVTSP